MINIQMQIDYWINGANDDFTVGKIWRLTRQINTKIEPLLIGIDSFKKANTSPLITLIKEKSIQII